MRVEHWSEVDKDGVSAIAKEWWGDESEEDLAPVPDVIMFDAVVDPHKDTHLLMHPDSVCDEFEKVMDEVIQRAKNLVLFLDDQGYLKWVKRIKEQDFAPGLVAVVITKVDAGTLIRTSYADLAAVLKSQVSSGRYVLGGEAFHLNDDGTIGGCPSQLIKLSRHLELTIDPQITACTLEEGIRDKLVPMSDLPSDVREDYLRRIRNAAPNVTILNVA